MECNKDFASQALLERRRRNNENGINRLIDRMSQEERMRKIITELSREMIAWKRQWLDLARTNEQYKREDTTLTTTTTLLNQIIIDNGWPTPQIARKKANRGGASQIQEHTY